MNLVKIVVENRGRVPLSTGYRAKLGLTLAKREVDNYATKSAPMLKLTDFYYPFRTKL
jgi:hypothetical protein